MVSTEMREAPQKHSGAQPAQHGALGGLHLLCAQPNTCGGEAHQRDRCIARYGDCVRLQHHQQSHVQSEYERHGRGKRPAHRDPRPWLFCDWRFGDCGIQEALTFGGIYVRTALHLIILLLERFTGSGGVFASRKAALLREKARWNFGCRVDSTLSWCGPERSSSPAGLCARPEKKCRHPFWLRLSRRVRGEIFL